MCKILIHGVVGRQARDGYIWELGKFLMGSVSMCSLLLERIFRRPIKESVAGPILKVLRCRTIINSFRHVPLTSIMIAPRARYSGPSRKLVVALDIGTTFSGAAYAFLDPGVVPEIRSVTKRVFLLVPDQVKNGDEHKTGT